MFLFCEFIHCEQIILNDAIFEQFADPAIHCHHSVLISIWGLDWVGSSH
jgi:hypothetical protein